MRSPALIRRLVLGGLAAGAGVIAGILVDGNDRPAGAALPTVAVHTVTTVPERLPAVPRLRAGTTPVPEQAATPVPSAAPAATTVQPAAKAPARRLHLGVG